MKNYYFALLFVIFSVSACTFPPKLGNPPILPNPNGQTERAVTFIPYGVNPRIYGVCTKVLVIDGGGIRGIIPAMILAEIERRTGKPISRLFHIVVGTSTGGILALGLSKPNPSDPMLAAYSAQDLVNLYKEQGEKIFPKNPLYMRNMRRFFRPKYSAEGMEEVFKKYFEDTALIQAQMYVSIPAYEIEIGKHYFFKSWYSEAGYFQMRDVVRAATAAPTYLPPFRIPVPKEVDERGYLVLIDGGIFMNNPAAYALDTALEVNKSRNILLVSLGTGYVKKAIRFEDAWSWGLFGWSDVLIDIVFSDPGVEKEMDRIINSDLESYGQYFRFQPAITDDLSEMDNSKNIEKLEAMGKKLIAEKKDDLDRIVWLLGLPAPPNCSSRFLY